MGRRNHVVLPLYALLVLGALIVGVLVGIIIVEGFEQIGQDEGQNANAQEIVCGFGQGMLIRDAAGELFIPTSRKPAGEGFIWWSGFEGNRGYMAPLYPEIQYVEDDCIPRGALLNYFKLLREQETHEALKTYNIGCVKYWLIVRDGEGQHLFPAKTGPYPTYNGDFIWQGYDGRPNKISFFRNADEPHRTVLWVTNPRCVWETIIDWLAENNQKEKEKTK